MTVTQPQPSCLSLTIQDVNNNNFAILPTSARCTCTAGPGFGSITSYHFNATGANPGDSGVIPDNANFHTWIHGPFNNTGATNVTCDIVGTDLSGNPFTTAGSPSCRQGFATGNPILPYSACVVGNPGTDCATNTYADQAACLLANPINSGRVCYNNDIPTCNANRATQCPVVPVCQRGNMAPLVGTIDATYPGLCPVGQAVGNFVDTVVGNTHNYTWTCNGLAGGNCNASFTSGGGGG